MKIAKIIPVFKAGNKKILNNIITDLEVYYQPFIKL